MCIPGLGNYGSGQLQLRVGPATRMTKMGPNVVDYAPGDPNAPLVAYGYFPAGPAMADYAKTQLEMLPTIAGANDDNELLASVAEVWSEVNVAHPHLNDSSNSTEGSSRRPRQACDTNRRYPSPT